MANRRIAALAALLYFGALTPSSASAGSRAQLAARVIEMAGIRRGLCAILGDARLTAHVAQKSELLVHAVDPDAAAVAAARDALVAAGLYGTRAIVEQGTLARLPYADNLIDVAVCTWSPERERRGLTLAELMRVLRPGGVAIRLGLSGAQARLVKPFPKEMDDWSHWQHGPDNNPYSADRAIKAPYMTQFLALPWFSTMPSISIISGGRMFRAAGHMAIHQREEQYLNTLYATNAYNGAALWTRKIPRGYLTHRSIFVATPDVLYLMEPTRCVLLDPQTGAEKGVITVPDDVAPDGRWRWIALKEGLLYALIGGKEDFKAEVVKPRRQSGHWGWNQLSKGYYEKKYPWGHGGTLVAIDVKTRKVRWAHQAPAPIDSRSLCLGHGKVFLHSEGHFVAALGEKTGRVLWTTSDPKLLRAISEPRSHGLGFTTTPYTICAAQALYFGGRGRKNVVAVSAADGKLLWVKSGAYNATNLLFRGGHLYAHIPECSQIEPLTGNVVLKLGINKRSCARFTGCPDALFHRGSIRGGEGTTRFDLYTNLPTVIHAFRPPCNDGIIPAGGLLHVTPWDCDCNLQLMGNIALCSAGDFRFGRPAVEAERLESHAKPQARFAPAANDWTTYRADPQRSSSTAATVPAAIARTWERQLPEGIAATPPTAAGGLLFLAGDDGIVRALDATTGRPRWTFATAGPVRIPPSIAGAMAYVGSADGYVYALEAATGRLVWRFRAAPVERRIMVFGKLCSTWPVNSGALVLDGVVYAAAGIINYDGTHVYALDAATGRIKWQNNTSGHLNKNLHEGVSAQGDIAVCGNRLLLAGGNVTSPGAFELDTGKCLNPPPGTGRPGANSGSFVCAFLGKHPMVGGRRLFTDDADFITNWKRPYDVLAANDSRRKLASGFHGRVPPAFGRGVVATSPWQGSLLCYAQDDVERWIKAPKPNLRGKPYPKLKPRWTAGSIRSCAAIVIAGNAVLAAGRTAGVTDLGGTWSVQAFGLADGKRLWAAPLPAEPLPNGLLINSAGRIFAVLTSGQIVCLAAKQ